MPPVTHHLPGAFCWFELATTDQAGAKQFYQSLFGWDVQDSPIGPTEMYSSFKLEGRDVAAAYTMRPEQRTAGVPPNWLVYVRVDHVDDTAALAPGAGGKVVTSPFDVMDLGRMSIVQDPTGAMLAVWEPKRNQGTGLVGENGTVVWADLITPDQTRAAEFYRALFGWQMVVGKSMVAAKPGNYYHIVNGDTFIGGIPPAYGGPGMPVHWTIYFAVADCQAAIAKATALGARVVSGPMTIEARTFAALADPQGAVFAVVESKK